MSEAQPAISLHYDEFSQSVDSETIVIVHGLFGSGTNWRSLAKALSAQYKVITVDCRNHGQSPWSNEHSYPAMAADLSRLIASNGSDSAIVIGHSMGGKAAMDLALTAPQFVKALVVVDIAPVRYKHSHDQFIDSMQSVSLDQLNSRRDADLRLSASIADEMVRQFLLQNLIKTDQGYSWRINLSVLAENMSTLIDFPMTESGQPFHGPTLFVRGGASDYVDPVRHDEIIHALFPNYRIETIDGAGHWLHAEQPKAFLDRVKLFLEQVTTNS